MFSIRIKFIPHYSRQTYEPGLIVNSVSLVIKKIKKKRGY